MIFRRISYWIAAQFTAFVFLLLLITGTVFFGADMLQRDRETHARLERQLVQVMSYPKVFGSIPPLPLFQRERIRITDASGNTLFSGTLYDDIPFSKSDDVITVERGRESYDILTAPFVENGNIIGYLQVADRSPPDDLSERMFLFLIVSGGISVLTFFVGLFFARRSLKPAEQMVQRLEQFTQDASHELRTPLTAVSTSLDLALASPDAHSHVQTAKRELKDVTTLVERLLELARLDAFVLKKDDVDLSALTTHVQTTYAPLAAERGITLTKHIAPKVHVSCDAPLTKQVIGNLLSNAIKFTPKGGTVDLTLTAHTVSVKDTGKGISQEALPHIFDRFFREDSARSRASEGLGLGLALTKRIVDLHQWSIDVKSEEGAGTTFIVRF